MDPVQFSLLQPALVMDQCLSSQQQPQDQGQGLSPPDGWLEAKEEATLQKDGTSGPPGGNLLPHHLYTFSVVFLVMAFTSSHQ